MYIIPGVKHYQPQIRRMPDRRYTIECYGATRAQAGRKSNEDAYIIEREPLPFAAVFDGEGHAEQAAYRVARFFKTLVSDQPAKAGDAEAWVSWIKLMDSYLMGARHSTFVGLAVPDVERGLVVGGYAGNSRAYVVGEKGARLLTIEGSPARLGSGSVLPKTFSFMFGTYDVLLLMSDGAWVPFGSPYLLQKTVGKASVLHFSEVPQAILDAVSPPDGPADDMTVVALRRRRYVNNTIDSAFGPG